MQVSKPPNRFTPEFQVYKKYKGWEIRRQVLAPRGAPSCRILHVRRRVAAPTQMPCITADLCFEDGQP